MKKHPFISLLGKYIKYPLSLKMDLIKLSRYYRFKKLGLKQFEPNYIYFDRLNPESTIIDVGCGFEAEFSVNMINKYGVKAFAVDPTHKHAAFLEKIVTKYPHNLTHLKYALSASIGKTTFYEAENRESGSLVSGHKNVIEDNVKAYEVDLIDIPGLMEVIGTNKIDFLKIDIEGAEYELFNDKNLTALQNTSQLFVEFHHISVENYSKKDTLDIVKKITQKGFESFTYDGLNYLFFKRNIS